ncbi:MAG: hypothetical protein LBR11_09230 [Deltaproteobacteria bacterium]|jgi:hypothetical protein|nr:hypothetical protein [Deltaproteobacteria bacterium]
MSETNPVFSKPILDIIRYSSLFVRLCLVLASLAVVVSSILAGASGLVGSLLGGGLVLANVLLLRRAVVNSRPGRLPYSIWWTILKFYLVFGASIVICVVVVKFQLGSPLAFLAGLSAFFLGLVGVLIWMGLDSLLKIPGPRKPVKSEAGQSGSPELAGDPSVSGGAVSPESDSGQSEAAALALDLPAPSVESTEPTETPAGAASHDPA